MFIQETGWKEPSQAHADTWRPGCSYKQTGHQEGLVHQLRQPRESRRLGTLRCTVCCCDVKHMLCSLCVQCSAVLTSNVHYAALCCAAQCTGLYTALFTLTLHCNTTELQGTALCRAGHYSAAEHGKAVWCGSRAACAVCPSTTAVCAV